MFASGSVAGRVHATNCVKLPFRLRTCNAFTVVDFNKLCFAPHKKYRIAYQSLYSKGTYLKCSASSGMNQRDGRFSDSQVEPFWVTLSKEAFRGLRSLVVFLIEQPRQLKHIEWPTFQSTLKTATLTLVLVAMLIVALSSVDSALCYILALLLRKPA
ncbi:hypothetical protein ACHQM5_005609 [Ranunculus cassubicifolius]